MTEKRRISPNCSGRTPRLYEQATAVLAQKIASGQLATDAPLTETHVAAMLEISRAPARQALAVLESRGLVRKAKGRGYRVRPIANDEATSPALPHDVLPRASWKRIYDDVESELAARISFGTWRIIESDLADYYDVSRTVARDVLGRLQERGIVDKDERSHWIAPALTVDRVCELYELRSILEPAALTRAAPNLDPQFVQALLSDVEKALCKPESVDGVLLDQLEHDLHVTLLSQCANCALMTAIRAPQSLLVAHSFLYRWSPRLYEVEPFLPEHRDILVNLLKQQIGEAARLLGSHLLSSSERASARIDAVNREGRCELLPFMRPH